MIALTQVNKDNGTLRFSRAPTWQPERLINSVNISCNGRRYFCLLLGAMKARGLCVLLALSYTGNVDI